MFQFQNDNANCVTSDDSLIIHYYDVGLK